MPSRIAVRLVVCLPIFVTTFWLAPPSEAAFSSSLVSDAPELSEEDLETPSGWDQVTSPTARCAGAQHRCGPCCQSTSRSPSLSKPPVGGKIFPVLIFCITLGFVLYGLFLLRSRCVRADGGSQVLEPARAT